MSSRGIWHRFLDNHPEYLARHYWWAYLWSAGVWFFDHQPVINTILFGQYRQLSLRARHDCMKNRPPGRFLQLTCVYGGLTPSLVKDIDDDLYLMDVAEIQLNTTRKKLTGSEKKRLFCTRMNAESLAYRDDSFSTILIFFLLHELPPEARERTLSEVVRVLRPGGRLVVTEYAPAPKKHVLWRLWPTRLLLQWLEPFLENFWQLDLAQILNEQAKKQNKTFRTVETFHCFFEFYCVCIFEMD